MSSSPFARIPTHGGSDRPTSEHADLHRCDSCVQLLRVQSNPIAVWYGSRPPRSRTCPTEVIQRLGWDQLPTRTCRTHLDVEALHAARTVTKSAAHRGNDGRWVSSVATSWLRSRSRRSGGCGSGRAAAIVATPSVSTSTTSATRSGGVATSMILSNRASLPVAGEQPEVALVRSVQRRHDPGGRAAATRFASTLPRRHATTPPYGSPPPIASLTGPRTGTGTGSRSVVTVGADEARTAAVRGGALSGPPHEQRWSMCTLDLRFGRKLCVVESFPSSAAPSLHVAGVSVRPIDTRTGVSARRPKAGVAQ